MTKSVKLRAGATLTCLVAIGFAAIACAGPPARMGSPTASLSNACAPPAAAARVAIIGSLRAGSSMADLSSFTFLFSVPRPHRVDVLAARVDTPLPKLGVMHLDPRWAWTNGRLFTLPGDATLAAFGVKAFAGAGGGLDDATHAVERCVARSMQSPAQVVSVRDVATDSASVLRLSGALSGSVRGRLTCAGTQASGSYPLGRSTLVLAISSGGPRVTVIHPPGGARAWVFLPIPETSAAGVEPGSRAVAFHSYIPYDKLQQKDGRPPRDGLGLRGTLTCG